MQNDGRPKEDAREAADKSDIGEIEGNGGAIDQHAAEGRCSRASRRRPRRSRRCRSLWHRGWESAQFSAPSNPRPTSDGTLSSARALAASLAAARTSTLFMRLFQSSGALDQVRIAFEAGVRRGGPRDPVPGAVEGPSSALDSGIRSESKVSLSILPVNLNGTS